MQVPLTRDKWSPLHICAWKIMCRQTNQSRLDCVDSLSKKPCLVLPFLSLLTPFDAPPLVCTERCRNSLSSLWPNTTNNTGVGDALGPLPPFYRPQHTTATPAATAASLSKIWIEAKKAQSRWRWETNSIHIVSFYSDGNQRAQTHTRQSQLCECGGRRWPRRDLSVTEWLWAAAGAAVRAQLE